VPSARVLDRIVDAEPGGANVQKIRIIGRLDIPTAGIGAAIILGAGADPAARDEDGLIPADLAEDNPAVRNHGIFWTLNEARFD